MIAALEKAMLEDRGFEVPVVLMTPQELSEVYDEACDFGGGKKLQGHYLSLLAEPPTKKGAEALEARSGDGEEVQVGDSRRAPDAEHAALPRGHHRQRRGGASSRAWPPPVT